MISWRNPDARHSGWGLDTYVTAVLDALGGVERICGTGRTAVTGVCAGGIIASVMAAHLAAAGQQDRLACLALLQGTGAARWPVGGCAGGERCRPWSSPVPGEVWAAGPGEGRREGGHGMPGRGGTRGGAGGGAGGSPKEAETSASNSASSHCRSSQIRSANAAPASRVDRVMPITLPGNLR